MRKLILLFIFFLIIPKLFANGSQHNLSKFFDVTWNLDPDGNKKTEIKSIKAFLESASNDSPEENLTSQIDQISKLSTIVIHAARPIFLITSKQLEKQNDNLKNQDVGFILIGDQYINDNSIKLLEAFNSGILFYLFHIDKDQSYEALRNISKGIYVDFENTLNNFQKSASKESN